MADSEAFSAACAFVLPFGKHKGDTVARVGASKEGLLYLDWLVGQPWLNERTQGVLKTYLSHPAISRQLDSHLED